MSAIRVICNRCHRPVDGMKIPGVATGGFYETIGGPWAKYARPGENILCDECMWSDPDYQKEFKAQVESTACKHCYHEQDPGGQVCCFCGRVIAESSAPNMAEHGLFLPAVDSPPKTT